MRRSAILTGAALCLVATPAWARKHDASPTPLTPPSMWYSGDVYPPAAMRQGAEGIVSALLSIDASGLVTGCRITESSGTPALDAATCAWATRRARFTPAHDRQGQAVSGTFPINRLHWTIKNMGAALPR